MEQIATRITFFVAGFGVSAWAPIVPYVKARTDLSDGPLGMLMLCLGIGSIFAMPVAGLLSRLYGCRPVVLAGALLVILTLPVLAVSASVPVLALALVLFGVGIGTMDCVINLQAIIVERASGRSMMSGFHGMFSAGGLIGVGIMALLLTLGLPVWMATLGIVAVIVIAMAIAAPHLLPYGSPGEGPAFAIPHGVVLLISILCFVVFLAEGAILDWSAVFMTVIRTTDATYAGIGYAAFALMMTISRFTGDSVVNRIGARRVLMAGPLCAAAGFLLAIGVPTAWAAVLGFGLVGAGCANVAPVLFSAIGRQTAMPEHVAVPAVTTIGYTGVLTGPAAIGFVAQGFGLHLAFALVAGLLVAIAFAGRRLQA